MTGCAAILGCSGLKLTRDEAAFFRDARPWGFILFARNVEAPEQVRALVDGLRQTVGRADAPVLIDQEGGRVARLRPPHWRAYPPGRAYGELAGDMEHRAEIARLGARLLAHDLAGLGINVDCAPVLDLPGPGGHEIIGDRAFGRTPKAVTRLGRAFAEGLMAGGVLPVIKHIPGHGRARADSHLEVPIVDAPGTDLEASDFIPFRALSDMPMAMTAHVIYAAVDPRRPATTSAKVLREVVRGVIGFEGLLISDDLSMKALDGPFEARARDAAAAGCDVVLHGNGDMAQMRAVVGGAPPLAGRSAARARAALARLPAAVEPFDAAEGRSRFDAAFDRRYAA